MIHNDLFKAVKLLDHFITEGVPEVPPYDDLEEAGRIVGRLALLMPTEVVFAGTIYQLTYAPDFHNGGWAWDIESDEPELDYTLSDFICDHSRHDRMEETFPAHLQREIDELGRRDA